MLPTDAGPAPAATTAPAAPAATTAPTAGSMSFDAASLTALRDLASSNATAAAKKDPIVLGHSKVADGGTLRRPEFFSVCDVAVFEEHEARLTVLSEVPKGAHLAFTAALHELPEQARDLLVVPVNPADMAKNQRLLVLQVLHACTRGRPLLPTASSFKARRCRTSARQRGSVRRTVRGQWRCATRSRGTSSKGALSFA